MSRRWDAFVGVLAVIVCILVFADQTMLAIIRHPSLWGIVLAIGVAWSGCMVTASVWRDRL